MVCHKIPRDKTAVIDKFTNDLFEITLNKNDYIKILSYDLILELLKNTGNKIIYKTLEYLINLHESKDWKVRVMANRIINKYNITGYQKELSIFDKLKANSLKII